MTKMKRGMALVLTATMVLGSTFTVFAEDDGDTTPATSGSTTGSGTSAGHVEQKTMNVVLPTEPVDASTFSYTMDPERLISGTSGKKYEDGAVFPATDDDTGVYFMTGEKKYENSSKKLTVKNESSHSIELTITAEAQTADTDIPLVAKDSIANAEDASLYLGLVVGSSAVGAINEDNAVTKTVTVAGSPSNFKVDVKSDKSGYEYRPLTLDEYKDLDGNSSKTEIEWASETFNLEGAVTSGKEITDTTSAPQVKVTWSWKDPNEEVIYTMNAGQPLVADLIVPDGTTIKAVTWNNENLAAGSKYTYANGKITFNSALVSYWISAYPTTEVTVTFNDETIDPVVIKLVAATQN